jgi:diaminopimelate decarboxylase
MDGGLAHNPRPALYGARYSALPVEAPERLSAGRTWLGDVLIEALPLPDMGSEELIAVPVSGSYQLSMGSNYNSARKPAVVWLRDGQAHQVQERETLEDLVRRDRALPQI